MNSTWKTQYLADRLNNYRRLLSKLCTHDFIKKEDLNDIQV